MIGPTCCIPDFMFSAGYRALLSGNRTQGDASVLFTTAGGL
jgi:hypothetical protein